ncbi:hypothetical protein MTO96_031864 [Rhipicephalus appendiculatus]
MRGNTSSKGPSAVVLCCLLALIPVMFCVALAIRYMTRGPRVVHEHTTTPALATTHHGIKPLPPLPLTDLTVPYTPKKGTEQYTGALPTDLEPVHYSVTIVLNGTALTDPELKWNAKAEAELKVAKATPKVILKGDPGTIKNLKMALLDDGTPPKGMNITTLSVSTTFLIAELAKPLEAGKTYTLLTEYEIDKSAPITATADFAKMQLKKDSAFEVFPTFEKTGWNVPIMLTLYTPPQPRRCLQCGAGWKAHNVSYCLMRFRQKKGHLCDIHVVCKREKTFSVHKFKDTLAMAPDMLSWSVFPDTLKSLEAVPNKVNLYMKTQNADLQKAAKTAFEFLAKYFQDPAHEHVAKIDIVFSKPADAQDSLGLIILDDATKPDDLCAKMAAQWTAVLTQPPATEAWLASAGVKYLCLLASTDESHLAPVFMKDFKDCMKPTPSPGTRELLVFRMAHIILGDAAFQKAIQSYVTKNIFKSITTDIDHGAFAPLVPKEYVAQWLKESFEVKKLERDFTTTKNIKWTNAGTTNTPFANSSASDTISLRTPTAVTVEWLNSSKAEFPVTATDKTALYLIGEDMEAKAPDAINGWYLLGQAAKQFKSIKAPNDFTGFMWMWAVLKSGDKDLWDDHVQQFVDTEKQAHSMIIKADAIEKYKKRVEAVIKDSAWQHHGGRHHLRKQTQDAHETGEIDKTFNAEPLDSAAVACYLGSKVKEDDDFDKLELPATPSTGTEATLPVRLAFCGCVDKTLVHSQNISGHIDGVYTEALGHAWDAATAAAIRLPQDLPEAALAILSSDATTSQRTPDEYKKVLKSAVTLKIFFTTEEMTTVKASASSYSVAPDDTDLEALEQAVVPDKPPLVDWIDYPAAAP